MSSVMPSSVSSKDWANVAWNFLRTVRDEAPLVQCITNLVSMDIVANVILAVGGSPAMIHSLEEVPDFTPNIRSLYINIGTLSADWLPSMLAAAELANRHGIPWVLDPVAAGISDFRLNACAELISLSPCVIRGNGSEILALSKLSSVASKGVDSCHDSLDAVEAAKLLARESGSIVAISGVVDIITDGDRVVGCHNGVAMMQKITATGCAVTALIAAFLAVDRLNPLEAAASAFSVFGIAGEIGMEIAKGPSSLRMHLIDSLHGLEEADVISRAKISSYI